MVVYYYRASQQSWTTEVASWSVCICIFHGGLLAVYLKHAMHAGKNRPERSPPLLRKQTRTWDTQLGESPLFVFHVVSEVSFLNPQVNFAWKREKKMDKYYQQSLVEEKKGC